MPLGLTFPHLLYPLVSAGRYSVSCVCVAFGCFVEYTACMDLDVGQHTPLQRGSVDVGFLSLLCFIPSSCCPSLLYDSFDTNTEI